MTLSDHDFEGTVNRMATVLAVLAHPDDETFICGGTLARFAAAGHRVVLVCATKGEMGRRVGVPPSATRESLPVIRERELKNACGALGVADLKFLGYRDKSLEIQPMEELVNRIVQEMEDEQPDLTITFHEQLGGHPDHCTIGAATTAAFAWWQASEGSLRAALWFLAWSRTAENPSHYGLTTKQIIEVDVATASNAKLQAYRAHETQSDLNEWLHANDKRALARLPSKEFFIEHTGNSAVTDIVGGKGK